MQNMTQKKYIFLYNLLNLINLLNLLKYIQIYMEFFVNGKYNKKEINLQ